MQIQSRNWEGVEEGVPASHQCSSLVAVVYSKQKQVWVFWRAFLTVLLVISDTCPITFDMWAVWHWDLCLFLLGASVIATAKDTGTTTWCVCKSDGWASEKLKDCQGQRQNIFSSGICRSKSEGVLREMIHPCLQTLCHPKCQPWKCHHWPSSTEIKETKHDFMSLNNLVVAYCGIKMEGTCWRLR